MQRAFYQREASIFGMTGNTKLDIFSQNTYYSRHNKQKNQFV